MYNLIIADDEFFTAKHLESIIDWESYGFKLIKIFTSGSDASEYIKSNTPDVIITDIKMPKVSGIDIAQYCHENNLNTSVIFLSAYSNFNYAYAGIKCNIFDFLIKPLTKKNLINVLTNLYRHLEKNKAHQSMLSDAMLLKAQIIIKDVLPDSDLNEEAVCNLLSELNIPAEYAGNACIFFSIEISDFEAYCTNIWKYNNQRLHFAISRILYDCIPELLCIPIECSKNNLKYWGISKKKDIKQDNEFYIQIIKRTLKDNLCFDCDVNNFEILPSVFSFKGKTAEFSHTDSGIINDIYEYIHSNYRKNISSSDAAKRFGFSTGYFSRFFSKKTGQNFTDALNIYRIEKAKEMLSHESNFKIDYIASATGFNSKMYFLKTFKKITGITPTEYRQSK